MGLFRRKMSGQPSLPLSSLSLRDEIFRLLAVHLSRAARHHDANMKRRKSRTNHARCERVNEKIVSDLNACAFGWNYRAVIGFKIGHCRQNRFFFLSLNVYAPSIRFVSRNRAREDATRTKEFAKRARRDRTRTLFRRRAQQ